MKLSAQDVLMRYKDEELPEFCELDLNNVNQEGNFGNRPIHVAAVRGNLDEIEALANGGADVNAKGERGNSALHEAAYQGHHSAVELLLRLGANPQVENEDQDTPADVARGLGHEVVAQLLLDWTRRVDRPH